MRHPLPEYVAAAVVVVDARVIVAGVVVADAVAMDADLAVTGGLVVVVILTTCMDQSKSRRIARRHRTPRSCKGCFS